jgi:hypothetical protein
MSGVFDKITIGKMTVTGSTPIPGTIIYKELAFFG